MDKIDKLLQDARAITEDFPGGVHIIRKDYCSRCCGSCRAGGNAVIILDDIPEFSPDAKIPRTLEYVPQPENKDQDTSWYRSLTPKEKEAVDRQVREEIKEQESCKSVSDAAADCAIDDTKQEEQKKQQRKKKVSYRYLFGYG